MNKRQIPIKTGKGRDAGWPRKATGMETLSFADSTEIAVALQAFCSTACQCLRHQHMLDIVYKSVIKRKKFWDSITHNRKLLVPQSHSQQSVCNSSDTL